MSQSERAARIAALNEAAASRILVVEGAMGTMIQGYRLGEDDFRGQHFCGHDHDLKGDNDVLNLTKPDVIRAIHEEYLSVGADLIETNTFNATSIAQADYALEDAVYDISKAGAIAAREAADAWTAKTPDRPRFVMGNFGPTNRTASISPDVNDPGHRNTNFDELRLAYREQARGLLDGGVDILLVETVFDTLNAKAAIFGIEELLDERGEYVPLMVSGTITDLSGRNLSGQTVEAFWHSIMHAKPWAVGLNCGFGADQLRGYVTELARIADTRIICYPNAGLPNEMGEYDEAPETTGDHLGKWARDGLLNIVGGCCGTTPAHIGAIAKAVEGVPPRKIPSVPKKLRLSGLEPFAA